MSSTDADFVMNGKSRNHKKGRYLHPNSEFSTTVDMDRIKILAEEIKTGPFESTYLLNTEYVTCVSILDFFFALIANLDPNLCGDVRDLIIQTAIERRAATFNAGVGVDTDNVETAEASAEPLLEPTSETVVVVVAMEPASEVMETEEGFTVRGREYPCGMSVCQLVICGLLDILSTGEPVYVPLSPDGVLVLFADFCVEIRNRSGRRKTNKNIFVTL